MLRILVVEYRLRSFSPGDAVVALFLFRPKFLAVFLDHLAKFSMRFLLPTLLVNTGP